MKKPLWISLTLLIVLLITSPMCAAPAQFQVLSLSITPQEVTVGEAATVEVQVKNSGSTEGVYTAVLTVDGKKVEEKNTKVAAGATVAVAFHLVKDKAGTYEIAVGGLSSSLVVKEKEVELKYDDGTAEAYASAGPGGGHLVHFSPPATPFSVKKVKIYGVLLGSGWEWKEFKVQIWDKDQNVLYSESYPFTLFRAATTAEQWSMAISWVEIEVPNVEVYDDFYVHVYTDSRRGWGVAVGVDRSIVNRHSNGTTDYEVWDVWPRYSGWLANKENVNWMIRVIGTHRLPGAPQGLRQAEFTVTNLIVTPANVTTGETAIVTTDVSNAGEVEGRYSVTLLLNGVQFETKEVVIPPKTTSQVVFNVRVGTPGVYEVSVGGLRQPLRVALPGQTAPEMHREAWLSVLFQAEMDKYYKYAIYASRSLVVKHPEVYLQGDDIFAKAITTTPGLKQSYETKDVHSQYFYQRQLQGDSFSFSDVDFGKYQIVAAREVYPPDYPFLPFFDRRLAPIATSLKTFDSRVTQFEKAEQLYFKAKEEGVKDLFLIYCDNENAYLYRHGSLLWAQNLEPVKTVEGNPILIFNERHVWYPLMERDDTVKSELLRQLVEQYGTDQKEPQLTDFEKSLLSQAKRVTQLNSEREFALATCVSVLHGYTLYNMMSSEIKQRFQNLGIAPWEVWRAWMEKSALLSPISAYLAATAKLKEGRAGVELLCSEYLRYARTPDYPYAHGHVWQCGMYEGGPEHAYRTHAGHCVVQSANIGAALRLAGIDYYRLAGFARVDEFRYEHHDFVYIPGIDVIISNGRMRSDMQGTVIDQSPVGSYKYLTFVEHDGKWAGGQQIYPEYVGTLSPKEMLEILKYLRSIHNDDIGTARIERFGKEAWEGELEVISFEQLERYLGSKQSHWSPYKLP